MISLLLSLLLLCFGIADAGLLLPLVALAGWRGFLQRLGHADAGLLQRSELMVILGARPEAARGLDQGGHILPGSRA